MVELLHNTQDFINIYTGYKQRFRTKRVHFQGMYVLQLQIQNV